MHHSLNDWLCTNKKCKNVCMILTKIIDTYTFTAFFTYTDMLKDVSLMLLISINLWVALNKCALHHYSLLHDYDSEFSLLLFELLLLSKKAQMKWLFHVKQYLTMRRKAAVSEFLFIFQSVHFQRLTHS